MYDVQAEMLRREREILEKMAYRHQGRSRRLPRAEARRWTRRFPGRSASDRTDV